MEHMNTRSKTGVKKNEPITDQPGSKSKPSGVTMKVTSIKTGSGGGKSGQSGGQASAQASKPLSHAELKKLVPNLEERLKAKEEEVTRLKAEKETALKEERDRMEMKLQKTVEKVELEKDGLLNLVKTAKERNTTLEEELEKFKKDVLEAKGDKKVLEGELQRLENEVKRVQEEKDRSNKEFTELQEAMERIEVERGELYEKMDKVEQDKREAVDEANELKKKMKLLQKSLEKERAEKQQLIDKGQKLEDKGKQPARSSNDEEEDEEFRSFDKEDDQGASQQPLGSDAIEKHNVIHMESVGKSVNALQKKRSDSQENISDSWLMVENSATCDEEPPKVSEKKLWEEIQHLKGQLKQQAETHRKTELRIRNEMEKQCKTLRRQIQEMENEKMSRQGLLVEEPQTELKRPSPSKLTKQDKFDPSFSSETNTTRHPSMGEMSKLETPPSVRRQHSYDAAVSISVTPAELTESALHRSLESHNSPRRTPSPTEGPQPGLVKQDFNFTIVQNLQKQLSDLREELKQLRQEKELLEAVHDKDFVQELKKELEDAKETIDSLETQLLKAVQNYSNENARRRELEEEKLARLREMTEWDRNRQTSLKDKEEVSKLRTKIRHLEEEVRTQQMLEKKVEDNAKEIEDLREEVEARKQHEQGLRRELQRALGEQKNDDQLKERLAKEIKSREELELENLTFKQIIEQFQADFNAERKDREGAAGTFADREKEWMEKIRMAGEERDHLKALTTQLQDQTTHQKHEMERLERELKESREMADGLAKKMTNQEAIFRKQEADHRKQEADHRNQVHALHKQLEKLNKEVAKLKAELADKKKDAKGSKTIEEAYPRLFDEKKDLECKLIAAMEAKSLASQHIQELLQENQTLKAQVEGTRQHLLQELQGVRTQYHVLSSQTITLREENEKLKQRMPTFEHQKQVYPHPIPAEESSYQSLPHTGHRQVVRQDYRPHPPHGGMPRPQYGDMSRPQYGNGPRPQYGDGTRPQHDEMQYPPYGGSPHSQDGDLEEKDSPPSSTQPGHAHLVHHTDPVTRTPFQDPRNPSYTGGIMGNSPVVPYAPHTVPGVQQGRGGGRGILQLDINNQQWQQQQQQRRQPLPRAHSTPERQESDVSSESILPSPMTSRPGQDSMTYGSDTSFQPNQRYIGDEINREISHEARQYKKAVKEGVPAPDDIDESIWPFDPNLECPHCGKRFRRGQIREYRYHLDDEHAPSLM